MGRLRTNINAPELIKQYPNYCDLESFKLTKKQIYLEIGSGKGDFLIQQAIKHSNVVFLGIEKYSTIILKALKKIQRNNLIIKNLFFSCIDAQEIDIQKFANSISKLYLNFSDPWPKKRHAKRRLTSQAFLDIYKKILTKNSIVEFKTDNARLYEYTLDVLKSRQDINVIYCTNNLYSDLDNKFNKENIQTEYEKKFVANNKNINKIIGTFQK